MENIFFCFTGLIMIGIGLLSIFAKDLIWEFTVWQNQAKGLVSERTDTWDTGTTLGGIIAILAGLFFLFYLFSGS